jgi:small GTP-binding protein
MLQKKICMLGAFSVGKTSLVKQFVASIFDDKYLTTVGVKIDKKELSVAGKDVKLMLWDLAGEDVYNKINASYLRGASGCIIVVDGTRPNTLAVGKKLISLVEQELGAIPLVVALNKADLKTEWELDHSALEQLHNDQTVLETSALNGQNVDEMFVQLTEKML